MRTSTAYEAIEDPNDPAWHGHAQGSAGEDRWRGRSRMVALGGVLVVVALLVGGVVAMTGGDASSADGAPSTKRARADVDPLVRPSAVVAADAIPALRADATVSDAADVPLMPAKPAAPIASPAGSGWAPAAATVAPQDAGSGLLKGDLTGVHPELIRRLDALAVVTAREIEVISGWRTRHEQEGLYQSFLSGVGNLAAVPGTSNHETGRAADVYVDGVALANVDGVLEHATALGLHFPVPGEAWHVEMVGT